MVVKFVGRVSNWKGKTLFEIAKRLHDCGKDRVVYRSSVQEKYPEKCYFKLTQVVPNMSDTKHLSGSAWGYKVYRGRSFINEFKLDSADKSDWILVPCREEEEFCRIDEVLGRDRVIPETSPLPPLLDQLYTQHLRAQGVESDGGNVMPVVTKDYTHERFQWK